MASYITYGNIVLMVTELLSFKRVPVYDGPTLLYNRVSIHVRCEYNPNAISYVPDPIYSPYIIPLAQNGAYPAITDQTIRFELSQPRQLLLYVVGDQVLVQSPGFQPDRATLYPCDAASGPFAIVHDIAEHIGRKTYVVDFAVETFVNEAWNEMVVAPVCLSHRWQRIQTITEDFYTEIRTMGHAVFRTDLLAVFQQNAGGGQPTSVTNADDRSTQGWLSTQVVPDDFRNYLFHKVPPGMKRDLALIAPSEDGTSIEYTLVDRQKDVLFPAGITRIVAWQGIDTQGGAMEMVGNLVKEGVGRYKKGFADAGKEQDVGEKVKDRLLGTALSAGIAGPFAGGVGRTARNIFGDVFGGGGVSAAEKISDTALGAASLVNAFRAGDLVPMMTITVRVEVHGDPGAAMQGLTQAAIQVVSDRFAAFAVNLNNSFSARTTSKWGWGMTSKAVSLEVSKTFPLPTSVIVMSGGMAIPDVTFGVNLLAVPSVPPETSSVLFNPVGRAMEIPNGNRAYYYGGQTYPDTECLAAQIFLTDFTGTSAPALWGNNGSIKSENQP